MSPPTALSPFAAAALTGGNPFRTMILTWKYLAAFVVPFVFTLRPEERDSCSVGRGHRSSASTFTATAGITALAATFGAGSWARWARPQSLPGRLGPAAPARRPPLQRIGPAMAGVGAHLALLEVSETDCGRVAQVNSIETESYGRASVGRPADSGRRPLFSLTKNDRCQFLSFERTSKGN